MSRLLIVFCLISFGFSHYAYANCTIALGMSQTRDVCDQLTQQPDFGCLVRGGREINDFANGSAFAELREEFNNCDVPLHQADHVAIQLSAPNHNRSQIKTLAADVVHHIRAEFPLVQHITLISSTGGRKGELCPGSHSSGYVRSSWQYNDLRWAGLADYGIRQADISVYASEVDRCSDFADGKGHLTAQGGRVVAAKWQGGIIGLLTPDPDPDPGACPILNGRTIFRACYQSLGFSKPFNGVEKKEIKACIARCE